MGELLTERIRSYRSAKIARRVGEPMGWNRELEPDGRGGTISSRTYVLVGPECRFTCSMGDLWKYTFQQARTPAGSISSQIEELNRQVLSGGSSGNKEWVKLYNASNFFDPLNIDTSEDPSISRGCDDFQRVVVENHASMLISPKTRDLVRRFRDLLPCELEIAMGLETIDPIGMKWLNKSMKLEHFQEAVEFLNHEGIGVRAFVLLQPLGCILEESIDWAVRSSRQAARWGAERICLIPTRPGNGFVENSATQLGWKPPTAWQLEQAFGLLFEDGKGESMSGSSVPIYTVDLWDWDSMLDICEGCSRRRFERLQRMNLTQQMVVEKSFEECAYCVQTPLN